MFSFFRVFRKWYRHFVIPCYEKSYRDLIVDIFSGSFELKRKQNSCSDYCHPSFISSDFLHEAVYTSFN